MVHAMIPALDATLQRRFSFFEHLGTLNHRGMHLIDPWTVGATLGFSHDETEYVLASLAQVGWIERIGPQRAFLTNLHVDMDYAELDRQTPGHVHPCHDGLAIEVDGE